MTGQATLSISTWWLKRLLNQLRCYKSVYVEIENGKIAIANPGSYIRTYCTFNEYYFKLISVDGDEPVQALLDVDEVYRYVKVVGSDTIVLCFLTENGDNLATKLELQSEFKNQIHLTTPKKDEIRWDRVEAIANTYDVEVPDVEDPWKLAHRLYNRISGELNRQYPEDVYQEIVEENTAFSPEKNHARLESIKNRFNSNNVFGTYEDDIHKPMPTRVQVEVDELCDAISIFNSLADIEHYRLIVNDKELRVKAPRISGTFARSVPALSITGPDIQNEYGTVFETIPRLSDTVELQTAPGGAPLALVQRGKGLVIRHVDPPA